MDEMLEIEIRAYLRTFENDCRNCYLAKPFACARCRSREGTRLARLMDSKEETIDETSAEFRHVRICAMIFAQLQSARRPMTSRQLKVGCSRSMKEWCLRRMMSLGRIARAYSKSGKQFEYTVKTEGKQ